MGGRDRFGVGRWSRWLALGILTTVAAGCGRIGDGAAAERPWNVLLVTFDTTRADRIGCYGNERIQTPTLDGLAGEGVRFAWARSAVPITAPSHSTILTGRYPIAHGVRDNGLFRLGADQVTLAEILRDHGYATAAAVGSFPLTAQFGLDQGFELFDDHLTGRFEDYRGQRLDPKRELFFDERRAAQVNEAILPWLAERSRDPAGKPFFAWVHYFDPHQPQDPAPPFDQLYADDLYDGEIAYADSRLGFLLDRLEELGELDRTLVVMTADHGEGLGDHNELTHAILAYESTLHVPLIVRPPGEFAHRGAVVEERVGTVDILPTILDLLGIEPPAGLQGTSLVPRWEGGFVASQRTSVFYAENLSPRLTHGWGELRVLVEGPMKLIFGPRPELYDLDADPEERHDLAAERPEEAERMRRNLETFLRNRSVAGVSTAESMDEETRKRLQALGYLHRSGSGGEVIVERLRSDGDPPQVRVADSNNLSAAKHLLFKGNATDALAYTEKLVRLGPDNPLYLELHATALLESGRREEAWALARRLADEGSLSEPLMLRLVTTQFDEGDQTSATDALSGYLAAHPSPRGWWVLASFREQKGDVAGARSALREALSRDEKLAPARVDLAVSLARSGEDAAAEREFRRAIHDWPYYPKGLYNYGAFLLHDGRIVEAEAHFRRAVALAPRYLEAHLAVVATAAADGRLDEAREAYRRLDEIAPGSREATTAAELLADPEVSGEAAGVPGR